MFVNLTEYAMNFNFPEMRIPRDGRVARVARIRTPCEDGFQYGVQFYKASIGEVEGLPEPQEGVIYIVAEEVARAVPHRKDVAFPAFYAETLFGEPVGINGLVKIEDCED